MAAFGFAGLAGAGGALAKPPKPPKAPKPQSIIGQAIAGHPSWGAGQPGQGGGLASTLGSAGSALLGNPGALGHPSATAAPAPAPAPAQPGASNLDSTYYGNVADYLFKTGNQINADQSKQANLDQTLQQTLGQLAYQQPRDQLRLEQGANQGGGLYSSVYNQNLGDLTHSYQTRQVGAETSHDQAFQALAAEIAALQGGVGLYENNQALDSAQRAAAAAQANPALGAPPAPAVPAPAAGGGLSAGVGSAGSALLRGAGNLTQPRAGGAGGAFGLFGNLTKGIAKKGRR